jgi:flagellar hook-associated protein 2
MTTRITGMISGLDIDSLVTAGVANYQLKLDKAKQQDQILQWKQDQYRTISSSVSDFYNKYLDPTSSDSLLMSSNWNTTSFTSSNSSAVSATATSSTANPSNYTVNVTQLAAAATTTLKSSDYSNGVTIAIGSNTCSLQASDITGISGWSSMTTAQQGAAVAGLINTKLGSSSGLTATYSDLSGGVVLQTNALGNAATFSVQSSGAASATQYYGKNLNATITNSNGTVYAMNDSNNVTTANTATLDGVKFTFNNTTSSSSSTTNYLTSASITNLLGNDITKIDSASTPGQTTYTLNGGSTVTITNAGAVSLTGTTNGTISLTESDGSTKTIGFNGNGNATVTSTAAANPVTITGSTDTSTVQKKIQSFMSDYNTLLTTINGKIYETYDSSYQPLTDSQKSSMTDTQITQWNTKAQTGLLHNDSYLETLAAGMKQAMSSLTNGLDIEEIGIKPVQDYSSKNGTYNVDSNALQSALNGGLTKNGKTFTVADIQSLFTTSNSTSMTQSSPGDGVLSQLKVALYNNVMESGSQFQQVAGVVGTTSEYTNEITSQLKDENTLISTLTDQLNTQEDALYAKYSNMETQLSTLDSSSSLFSSGN